MQESKGFGTEGVSTADFFAQLSEPDYYSILNVSRSASRVEIREAYLRLKNSMSSNQTAFYSLDYEEASKKMLGEIEKAFCILENDITRVKYDEKNSLQNEEIVDGAKSKTNARTYVNYGLDDSQQRELDYHAAPTVKPVTKSQISVELHDDLKDKIAELLSQNTDDLGGAEISKIREMHSLTLKDVFEVVRIPVNILEAMEKEDFENLPGKVYVRGFLSNYLRFLAVDEPSRIIVPYIERYEAWIKK